MTRLLVIAIALVLAWVWVSRQVRRTLSRSRNENVRSVLRFIEVLRSSARGQATAARGSTDARAPGEPTVTNRLVRCRDCGVHVPEAALHGGVCSDCRRDDGSSQR